MLLPLLLACTEPAPTEEKTTDVDGDGVEAPADCDDASAAVFPGADERCNGADDDCDGAVDEEPVDGVVIHADGDGDGHGEVGEGTTACSSGDGVASADDCDDADPSIHPDAAEVCDGVDQDCDGEADEGLDTATWFRDQDGDGIGATAEAATACAPPEGYVEADGDCDDADAGVYPGAPEVTSDGVDQDCDGADAACVDGEVGEAVGEIATGSTAGSDEWAPSCAGAGAGDRAFVWTAPYTGVWRFSTEGSGFEAAVGLHREGCGAEELACEADGEVATWANAGDVFTVVVDGVGGAEGDFVLTVIEPGTTFGTIAAGYSRTCLLAADGTASCHGNASGGVPADVYTFLAVGSGHACGIHEDGTVGCWGTDTYGESSPPAEPFLTLTGGMSFAMCGLQADRDGACWGESGFGELSVPSTLELALISLGYTVGMGLEPDGTPHGWGDRTYGESTPPSERFVQLAAGHWAACGIRADLTLDCWGSSTTGLGSPPAGEFVQVSLGSDHACAIDVTGAVQCWGYDQYGRATPPAGTFTEVSAGKFHTCGRHTDGTVECWGADFYGESSGPEGA